MRAAVAFALLVSSTLAGCLAPPDAPAASGGLPSFEWVDPIVAEHNHSEPAEHALATPTMEMLSATAFTSPDGSPLGLAGEADVRGALAAVAITGIGGETPGFALLDVADARSPRVLSFTPSPQTGRLADVKIHPSGAWLLAAAQSGTQPRTPSNAPALGEWSSQNGLRIYDIRDPAAPVPTLMIPSRTGYGCHMLAFKAIGGEEWLFCVGRAIEVYLFDNATGTAEIAAVYAPQGERGVENILANDASNPQGFVTEARLSVTPHDMTVQDDPVTGDPILLVSWWDLGVRVVDVRDPRNPREIGAWAGEGASTFEGNVHSALATLVNGRRVVVATPELLRNDPAAVWLLDASDWSAMGLVGEWVNPGRHGADGIRFSTHNVQVANERLYMAHYHAGVWVLDLRALDAGGASLDDAQAVEATLGYYLPHEPFATFLPPEATSVPDVWDVVLKDGVLWATDVHTGFYALRFLGDELGDASASGFA